MMQGKEMRKSRVSTHVSRITTNSHVVQLENELYFGFIECSRLANIQLLRLHVKRRSAKTRQPVLMSLYRSVYMSEVIHMRQTRR